TTSASESSRAWLPATSAFWTAASSMRRVARRRVSLAFIAAVMSARRRCLSSDMGLTVVAGRARTRASFPRAAGHGPPGGSLAREPDTGAALCPISASVCLNTLSDLHRAHLCWANARHLDLCPPNRVGPPYRVGSNRGRGGRNRLRLSDRTQRVRPTRGHHAGPAARIVELARAAHQRPAHDARPEAQAAVAA